MCESFSTAIYRIAYLIKDDGNIDVLGVFHGSWISPSISSDGTLRLCRKLCALIYRYSGSSLKR
jgi:hypothetical protein